MKFNVFLFGFKPKTHCIYQFCFCKYNNILIIIINILRWIVVKKRVSFFTSSYNLQNIIKVLDDSLPTSVPYDAILMSENFHFH